MPDDVKPDAAPYASIGEPISIDDVVTKMQQYREQGYSFFVHHLKFAVHGETKVIEICPAESSVGDDVRQLALDCVELRQMLAFALSPGLVSIYTDDGELQGHGPVEGGVAFIDFKRDSVAEIKAAISRLAKWKFELARRHGVNRTT